MIERHSLVIILIAIIGSIVALLYLTYHWVRNYLRFRKQWSTERLKNPLHRGSIRNKPCPCGSGKKAKRCHAKRSSVSVDEYNEIVVVSKEWLRVRREAGLCQ